MVYATNPQTPENKSLSLTSYPNPDPYPEKSSPPFYNVPIDVDIKFDPNPISWTLKIPLILFNGPYRVNPVLWTLFLPFWLCGLMFSVSSSTPNFQNRFFFP